MFIWKGLRIPVDAGSAEDLRAKRCRQKTNGSKNWILGTKIWIKVVPLFI
jgi:hypothetical protein